MGAVQRVAKNTIVMVLGDAGAKLLTLIYIIYAARYLRVEGFGILSFSLAVTGIFSLFADIGFYELTVREVARDRSLARKYTSNVILLKAIIVGAVFGLLFVLASVSGYPYQTVQLIYILGIAMVLDSFSMVLRASIQAFEEMEYISIGKILRNTILLGGVFPVIYFGYGLLGFGALYLVANLSSLVYLIFITGRRVGRISLDVDRKFWRWLIKEGVPFWASTAFVVILNDTDKVMLSLMVGDEAVGFYSAAYRTVFALNFIPVMFISAMYPVTSRLYVTSKSHLIDVSERSFKYVLIAGLFLVVMLNYFSDFIMLTVFGGEYLPSSAPLKILAWSQLFLYLNIVHGNLFKSANRQIVKTYQTFFAAVLNILLNLAFIPQWSFIGASVATLISRFFSFTFLSVLVVRDYDFSKHLLLMTIKVMLIALGFVLASLLTGNQFFIYSFIFVVLPLIVYFGMFDEADKQIIAKLIRIFK